MVIGMNRETKSKKLNLRWLAYLALVLVSFIQPPSVKSAEIHVNQTSDVAIITVTGELELGDHLRFIKAVLPVGRGIVVLGSEGGNLQAGIEIGKAIRLKDLTTYVPDDILCASACALAWLGGTQRFMAANAKIGFHAAFRIQNGSPTESGLGNALVGAYLNSLGLSQRAVAFISSADPRSMQWLTIENAPQNGIEVGRLNLNENRSSPAQTARPNISTQPASRATPQFGDYPAGYWHQGPNADVDLSGPAWNYRTRLRRAAQLKPNFGGRYIVVEWGCGTECVTGAIIDAPTGKVTFLPFNVCCSKSSDPNFSAIEFRIESRLLIFTGMLSENTPIAKHFYHFDGASFHSIGMIGDDGNLSKNASSPNQPSVRPIPQTPSSTGVRNILILETRHGRVSIQLRADLAPRHVSQLKVLARRGFYDGIAFHRVIDGFMAQTGDPTGTGTGRSDLPNISAEFTQTHFLRGTVGMARAQDPNSANSQFFICFNDTGCAGLRGQYTVVGQVLDGMSAIDRVKRGAPGSGMVTSPDRINRAQIID